MSDYVYAKGEQLHIITNIDQTTMQCVEMVIKKYGLKLKDEANKIVVYEPITEDVPSNQ